MKERGVKDKSKVFGLNILKNSASINSVGEDCGRSFGRCFSGLGVSRGKIF